MKYIVLTLFIAAAVISHTEAQTIAKTLPVSKDIKIGKLANGLTYYIRRNLEPRNRAELRLVVNAGSVLETDKQAGLAHFVEHMAFNGTAHFKKNELVNFLEKSGVHFGADLNAYTSFDETVYELQVPTDSPLVFKQGMQILEDWAQGVSFEHTEIDKERGVIVEEWRLGRGADARLRDRYFPILLKGSQYAKRIPIGTKQNIDTAHYQTLTSFYKDWYRPDLQAVVVVGDIDVAETEQLIMAHFGKIPKAIAPKKRTRFLIPSHTDTRTAILTDPEQPYSIIQVYYTRPELPVIKTETQYRQSLVRSLFNEMMSARLDEIAQKPEAPFLFGSSSYGKFIGNLDAFSLLSVAKSGREIQASLTALLTENERVKQYGFQQSELDRAVKNMLSRIENRYRERDKTKSAEHVQELVNNYLHGEAIPGIAYEYALYRQYLPGITLKEINGLIADWIRTTDRSVVITAPEKEKNNLPAQATVIALLNKPFGKLDRYIDKISSSPLLPVAPVAGKTLAEKKYEAINTTEWTLSNGARVILKPTDFKNDEIEFSAISWGGASLYDGDDFLNASNAAMIVSSGGMGDMDMQAMQKALSGKNCFVGPGINTYMQGLNGRSTQKDLATAFELLNGSFTAPRKDPQMFEVIRQQVQAQLQNKDKDPASVFGDSVNYIMSNYHPLRKPFTVNDIGRLNLDKAYGIYRQRFSNAGQFIFTFVGNFSLDSIRPLVEKYIASLPATATGDSWRDVGIRYPAGPISKLFYKGKENKASVRLFFTGTLSAYQEDQDRLLGQLCAAMTIRLRELMREDAGGVYGVSVNGGISREPVNSYSIGVSFGCAPANVDKLVAIVTEEIRRTRQEGVSQQNVDKVIAEQTRSLENSVKENSYWRYRLEQQFFRNNDPLSILTADKRIRAFSVEKSKETANSFLNENNLIKLVLLPEK
ncbi:M16 family metallopeptidase [Sediminibacterium soli]|uniref:M16 family metallopeptidase n=1 Tax=Sediminibacterium soli TaxID=2698829 RepID=UPI00137A39E0|nr:M16 family metallopeptidase [Sediminibacterium soli]NCI46047.1 insulinase family protein [Sediminibacterium soli]